MNTWHVVSAEPIPDITEGRKGRDVTGTYYRFNEYSFPPPFFMFFDDFRERGTGVGGRETSMYERNIDWLPLVRSLNPQPRYVS